MNGEAGMVFLAAAAGVVCTLATIGLGGLVYWMIRLRPPQPVILAPPPPPVERKTPSVYNQPAPPAKSVPDSDIYQTILEDDIVSNYPWLEGIGGVISGQRFDIYREETLLGRSRVCDVQIHDPKVSRQHALLRLYNGKYFIQDVQSSRGTLVNNRSIETHPLSDGDEIRLGDSTLLFHMPGKSS